MRSFSFIILILQTLEERERKKNLKNIKKLNLLFLSFIFFSIIINLLFCFIEFIIIIIEFMVDKYKSCVLPWSENDIVVCELSLSLSLTALRLFNSFVVSLIIFFLLFRNYFQVGSIKKK